MDAILQLDQNILLFIQEYIRHDWMDWFWKGITHLGDFGIFWILLTIVLLIPKKTRKAGLASALALIIGTLITNVAIKNVVARIRPYEVIQELELMIEKQGFFLPFRSYMCIFCISICNLQVQGSVSEEMENCGNGIGYFDRIIEIICRGTLSDRRSRRIDRRTILGLGRMED